MNRYHKQRLVFIVIVLCSIAMATSLALYALQQNINLFYTPSQIYTDNIPKNQIIRLGGIVQKNSYHHLPKNLAITFRVADQNKSVEVQYTGILPDLFREGQGVVVEGKLNTQKILIADQVLAKHDEKYMPAAIKKFLNKNNS